MIHIPGLSETRTTGVSGHDPSLPPRISTKMMKRSTNTSLAHDPSRGLCAVLPTVRTTKQSYDEGHDRQKITPGVSPTVKETKQSYYDGHDRQKNASVALHASQRNSSVPGHNTQYSASGVLNVGQPVGRCNRAPVCKTLCRRSGLVQSDKAGREQSLRWCSAGPTSLLSIQNHNRSLLSTTSPNTGTSPRADLQLRRPKTESFSLPLEYSVPSGKQISQNPISRSPSNSNFLDASRFNNKPLLQTVRPPLELISPVSKIGSKQTMAQRLSCFLSSLHVSASQAVPSGQILRLITNRIGGLVSGIFSKISGDLHSSASVPSTPRPGELILTCLSFCARHMMSAKKGLQLYKL